LADFFGGVFGLAGEFLEILFVGLRDGAFVGGPVFVPPFGELFQVFGLAELFAGELIQGVVDGVGVAGELYAFLRGLGEREDERLDGLRLDLRGTERLGGRR